MIVYIIPFIMIRVLLNLYICAALHGVMKDIYNNKDAFDFICEPARVC